MSRFDGAVMRAKIPGEKEMQTLMIRKLREEDLESLARLHKQFWGVDSNLGKMHDKFWELKNNPKHNIICATVGEIVVGSMMGIICDELYGECKPFLIMENLVVDQQYRNKGIGKALMGELERFAHEWNCAQIQFITEANRKDAISFYKSEGYDPKGHVGFKKSLNT